LGGQLRAPHDVVHLERVKVVKTKVKKQSKKIIGWREWISMPELGIPAIKAKIDTGARTSALHAFKLEPFEAGGLLKVRFSVHPLQKRKDIQITCIADVIDQRRVKDSSGNIEERYVIRAMVSMGMLQWPIDITLTSRYNMLHRMLLGRSAIKKRLLVDPGRSYYFGQSLARHYPKKKKPKL
jgi:hypothetical protein